MTNPFAALNVSDDQDEKVIIVKKTEQKPRRTHQEKKLFKQQQQQNDKRTAQASTGPVTHPLPEKIKESHQYKHMERPKADWKKELGEGHYLDRRSGTGRQDRPRKAGGGYGNVGNVKDVQKEDRYLKEYDATQKEKPLAPEEETGEVVQEQKEPEPEALTLEEYYKAKGVNLEYNPMKKVPSKKTDVNANWIQKEKLTVLMTREDIKKLERSSEQTNKRNTAKIELGIDESDFNKVGFGQKSAPRDNREAQRAQEHPKKGGKKNKPQFTADDFPSL